MTRSLTESVMNLNANLNAFHGNFAKFTASRMTSGQSELRDVAQKVGELEAMVGHFYQCVGRLLGAEATFLVFATSRMIMSSGRSGKTKMSRHRTTLTSAETTAASRAYEQVDRIQSELTHADYASQLQHRKTDTVTTSRAALSTLVSDQMILTQAILGLSLAIWARLQTDCRDILAWLQGTTPELPAALSVFNDGNRTAVLTGLAPNGGLYIPEDIPQLPDNWQTDWKSYSFQELSVAVLSLFISPTELSRDELRSLVEKSYATFRHPDVTPLKKLNDKKFILELFHGPTFAFKDVALQLLGNLFEFFLLRRNARKEPNVKTERLTVVGATSGDTGSAAIYGLRNKANISIFILHPKGRVSPIQEAQMTTVTDPNVFNIAVKGTFDDCQDIVKALFSDREFNDTYHLGAVNSINWARILAQTVYYFLAYFHIHSQLPESDFEIQYVVPTGNFGDILAGYYAKRMGLPMGKLVVATNANDILARFWKSGKYEKVDPAFLDVTGPAEPTLGASDGKQAAGTVKETYSPAMDILVSSNFERLLWYLAYENALGETDLDRRRAACATLNGWMSKVKQDGSVEVPTEVLASARRDFLAEKVSDELTLSTIKSYFEGSPSYVADPHTAVGLAAAEIVTPTNSSSTKQIVLSTAHPAKFSEAVSRALDGSSNFEFDRDVLPNEFHGLLSKEKRVIDVEQPNIDLVKAVIEKYTPLHDSVLLNGSGNSV
ncbi:hypothetical protein ONZ45_g1782 [Pleurotus djamor]|nr:hypothetical protein ONZ45_g1782 [Pleurotus djamor]